MSDALEQWSKIDIAKILKDSEAAIVWVEGKKACQACIASIRAPIPTIFMTLLKL